MTSAPAKKPLKSKRSNPARPSPPISGASAELDIKFLTAGHSATALTRGIAWLYARVLNTIEGRPGAAWLTRDHFLFFVLAAFGLALLMPRVMAMAGYAIERFLLRMEVAKPTLAGWPALPTMLLPLVVFGLLAFWIGPSARPKALFAFSIAAGFAFGYLDLPSLLGLAAFAVISFALIRMPISRLAAALTLGLLSIGLFFFSRFWPEDSTMVTVATFQTTLIPVLWYSAYEHKASKRPLDLRRFGAYLYVRCFSGPVFTYPDMFTQATGARLAEVRFGGIKTLYIAAVSSIAAAASDRLWRSVQVDEMMGLPLLLMSYASYVGERCKVVAMFNAVSGVLRLFGLPIRDNFHYWLLARTPNEHWQRWNLLFREWVITFVFFPIMKSKRWLFAAVMAALLTSGLLHVLPAVLTQSQSSFGNLMQMGYWVVNGLAIYAVIKIPTLFPKLVPALGIRGSLAWSVLGVVATSSFYAVLHGVRVTSGNWTDVGGYFERLTRLF
jgi:hypothetical protein